MLRALFLLAWGHPDALKELQFRITKTSDDLPESFVSQIQKIFKLNVLILIYDFGQVTQGFLANFRPACRSDLFGCLNENLQANSHGTRQPGRIVLHSRVNLIGTIVAAVV